MIAIFPELSSCAKAGDIEKLAILARSYFSRDQARRPKVDMVEVMKGAGVQSQVMEMDAFGAIAVSDQKGSFRILTVYRSNLAEREQRFILAHLLGHILVEIQPAITEGQVGKLGYKEEENPMERYCAGATSASMPADQLARELQADRFAVALLMPEGMVRRAVEKIGDLSVLGNFFGVTIEVMSARLVELGLTMGEPNGFLDGEQKLKGKIQESPLPETGPLNLNHLKAPTIPARASVSTANGRAQLREESLRNLARPSNLKEAVGKEKFKGKEVAANESNPIRGTLRRMGEEIGAIEEGRGESEFELNLSSKNGRNERGRYRQTSSNVPKQGEVDSDEHIGKINIANKKIDPGQAARIPPAGTASPGMARLREIAKMIDKSVD